MKTEEVNEILRQVRDYERTSFGIKYGPDYSQLAETISNAEEFKGFSRAHFVMAALEVMSLGKDEADAIRKIDQSPLR